MKTTVLLSLLLVVTISAEEALSETFRLTQASVNVSGDRAEITAVSDLGRLLDFPVELRSGADPTVNRLYTAGEIADLRTAFGGRDFHPINTLVDGALIDWYEPNSTGTIHITSSILLPTANPLPLVFVGTAPATLERLSFQWVDNPSNNQGVAFISESEIAGTATFEFHKNPSFDAYNLLRLNFEFVPEPRFSLFGWSAMTLFTLRHRRRRVPIA